METERVILSTRQNWSDMIASKNVVLKLMKKVEEREKVISNKEPAPQPVPTMLPKSNEEASPVSNLSHSQIAAAPVFVNDSQQNTHFSMIKIPARSNILFAAEDGIKARTVLEIPQTPKASLPVEIRQLILPPVISIRNKGILRMDNESMSGSTQQVDQSGIQTSVNNQDFMVRYKAPFRVPETTESPALPVMPVSGPEKLNAYTLSVPPRPRSMLSGNASHCEILPNKNPIKNSSVFKRIEADVNSTHQDMENPNIVVNSTNYSGNYEKNTIQSKDYAVNPDSNEMYAMNIDTGGDMVTTSIGTILDHTKSLQSVSPQCSSHGSWFDNWGHESNLGQQGLFSLNSSIPDSNSGMFSDGFLNKDSEVRGFSFVTAQDSSTTESFFSEAARTPSTFQDSTTGFGLSCPFNLQNSGTSGTSMFTF